MGYLTENRLSEIIDIPIALPATELIMGDWVAVGTIKITQPMRLSCRLLGLQLISSTVPVADITANNQIYGNLGLAYLVLRKNYQNGVPGSAGGLDTIIATGIGLFERDPSNPVVVVEPGNYTWLLANNTKATNNTSDPISPATSINFVVSCLGTARLELSYT